MAEDQEKSTLENRAANLKATLDLIHDIDRNGDHKLTQQEFADLFVRTYAQQHRGEANTLDTLREDIAAIRQGEDSSRLTDHLFEALDKHYPNPDIYPMPESVERLLLSNVADGAADVQGVTDRVNALVEEVAEKKAEELQAWHENGASPEVIAQMDKAMPVMTREQAMAQEKNPELQKIVSDLRAQLAGYKQENVEGPPSLQNFSVAIDNASKGPGGR